MLVGNKCDENDKREVNQKTGEALQVSNSLLLFLTIVVVVLKATFFKINQPTALPPPPSRSLVFKMLWLHFHQFY
jgi:hypothetical protein